ncbi:MAG: poly-beta-1,6-N-acetyl-D-glucosamine biosynthesis protein PgaD [Proteobacteria bacterium]|nr:poly-beta-1,6-N-acetyl-D-glucosamine biosynthesis protein PgaD [Pseudomonadota bacterium]HCF72340.1 poly-beta-1,6-N-acetyl-D-glucosamine biosynthesis protein PgaD [Gammaproteobacteria bacterium]|tara:strand:- start:499 stop:1002 length:504 start_codon:yes stop_codon:yes gene_type:complete
MDKPGSGHPEPSEGLIIESPGLLSRPQRIVEIIVTLIVWIAILYLWQPLVRLLWWLVQSGLTDNNMSLPDEHIRLLQIFQNFLLPLLAILIVYLGWAKVNQWRFRGREQRASRTPIDAASVSQHYKVDPEKLRMWRRLRQMVIELSDTGYVTSVHRGSLARYRGVKK